MNTRSDLVPTKPEHITPEWLSAFLGTRTPGVQVEDLEVLNRSQGAATRLRVRVRYAAGTGGGLPEVLFIKTSLTRQMLVADPHMYLTEVYFYDRLRPEIEFETPAVYPARSTSRRIASPWSSRMSLSDPPDSPLRSAGCPVRT